jgi:hypothetical protein
MRKYIHKYLDEKYYIKASEAGNDGIYLHVEKEERYQYPVKNQFIIDELVTLFAIEPEEAKLEIHLWAIKKKPDVDLEFFWKITQFENIAFPIVQRVFAQTIAHDLVPVQAMSMPKLDLVYLDYVYGNKPWYKKLWDKVKGFFRKKSKKKIMHYGVLDHEVKNQWLEQYSAMHLAQQNEL